MDETPAQQPPISDTPPPPRPRVSKKMLFIMGAVGLVFLFFLFSMMLSYQAKKSSSTEKTSTPPSVVSPTARRWQILLSYNPTQQDLELKSISIEKGDAAPLKVSNSSYMLRVYDKTQQQIYETPISVTEAAIYDIYVPPTGKRNVVLPTQPRELDTSVTVPYLANADTIKILKNKAVILEFTPPKDNSLSLVTPVYADAPVCKALSVIFVSDGYTDKNKFESDAAKIESTLTSVAPYNTEANKAIFNFKTVWNTTPLGCISNGTLVSSCVLQSETQSAIRTAVGSSAETAYNKYIVLADASPQVLGTVPANGDTSGLPKILGSTNAAGGDYVVTQSREYAATSTVHEIGGHAIGQLYDRYVDDVDYTSLNLGPHSNCSDSATDHPGWTGNAYKGCTKSSWYAPAPTADPVKYPACAGGGNLLSGGTPDSVMSAAGCFSSTTPSFDTAETTWISNLLKANYESYKACQDRATTATPTPVASNGNGDGSPANTVSSLPAMVTDWHQCGPRPADGQPGTEDKNSFHSSIEAGSVDAEKPWEFGALFDSTDKNDLYYTTGQANGEARWAGSSQLRPNTPHERGAFYTRPEHPNGFERVGGYVYNSAYDWSPYEFSGYPHLESMWTHVMRWTREIEDTKGGNIDRNCVLATQIQRLIHDDKERAKDTKDMDYGTPYYAFNAFYRVATPPTPSGKNSVIKVKVAGKGVNNGWYPSVELYINQYKVKTWKDVGKDTPYPKAVELTYPDTSDGSITIGQIKPSQIQVAIARNSEHFDEDRKESNGLLLYGITIDGKDYPAAASTTLKATNYDAKRNSTMVKPGKGQEFTSDSGSFFSGGYMWFDYPDALKDPYNSPTMFADISADGSKGTGTPGGSTNGQQQYYTCSVDPACKAGKLGVQLCALKCVPK